MVGHALGVLQLAEQEDRIGDKVDRHHVDRCLAARRQGEVGAARECSQRPVQDVERRRPAGVALPHDDARAKHRDRQLPAPPRDQPLCLELRLLVGVAKALADVEVLLGEQPRVLTCHIRGRDIAEPPQAGAPLTELGELQHAPRALDVHLSRLLEAEVELHRRGDVDDVPDSFRELVATPVWQAEPLPRDVPPHGADSTNV